ncbi:HU family DNA-binding protein [Alistipes indistinctus]|uniref:HU family DNA-binding protein n=1 Tax=Alistipes indistinctus TaxID=626932 RepID=UPI003AB15BA0
MAKRTPNITKADLINEIAGRTGISKADTRAVLEEFVDVTKETLAGGMSIQIRGFGSFIRKQRASKKARNIKKNTTIEIPAHEVPAFKPCKSFVDSIRNS